MIRNLRKVTGLVLAAALLFPMILSSCAGAKTAPLPELAGFGVTVRNYDSLAVGEDAVFEITCDAKVKKEQLESVLLLEPSVPYSLKKEQSGLFTLTPASALAKNTLYNLTIGDETVQQPRTWAFQTQRAVGITGSLPANNSQYVPLDTGIEIALSHMDLQVAPVFAIEPPTPGTWTRYKTTAVFMPSEPLEPETLYTVTIGAGAQSAFGTTQEAYTFRFRTDTNNPHKDRPSIYLSGNGFYETFLPGEAPVIPMTIYNVLKDRNIKLNTYRLGSYTDALAILRGYWEYEQETLADKNNFTHDVSGMTPLFSSAQSMEKADMYNRYVALLPQPLEEAGYYLIDMELSLLLADGKTTPHHVQKLIQVTDTALYLQGGGNAILGWVNDTVTGGPVAGAELEIAPTPDFKNAVKVKTDANGVASAGYSDMKLAFYRITQNGETLFAGVWNENYYAMGEDSVYQAPLANRYNSMLYTDRAIYLPDDTIRFWGVLRPRDDDTKQPESITAAIRAGGIWSGSDIAEITLPVDEDGVFSGSLPIESAVSDMYYVLAITDGDKSEGHDGLYQYAGVTISNYSKPEYVMSVTQDKTHYTGGDTLKADVQVSFFDGTPAAGIGYWLRVDDADTIVELFTDKNGKASASFPIPYIEDRYLPYTQYYWMESTGAENVMSSSYGDALVIPRDTILDARLTQSGTAVEVEAFRVDESKIVPEKRSWEYNDKETLRGAPADLALKAEVWRVDIIRKEIGESYDYINKKTIKRYETTQEESLQKTFDIATVGGKVNTGALDYKGDKDKYYYLKLIGEDKKGRPIQAQVYLGSDRIWRYDENSLKEYRMLVEEYANLGMWYNTHHRAQADEEINFVLMLNQQRTENEGKILSTVCTDEVLETKIITENEMKLLFSEEYFPNVSVSFSYFDGKRIYAIEPTVVTLIPDAKELVLDIQTDKERYQPGDTVSALLAVTDKGGNPVQGSAVLSVVDEAVFAVLEQSYDAAADLYSLINYPYVRQYASYVEYDGEGGSPPTGGGGMGGGGGADASNPRKNFLDTACFYTAKLDKDGKASVSFPLPDNLTEWRITAVGISTDGRRAGNGKLAIRAGVPFFVQPIVSALYLEQDDVVLSARVRGSAQEDLSRTAYTATLLGDGVTLQKLDAQGEYASFHFGKLTAGRYQAVIEARGENATDAVAVHFTVADSGLELPVLQSLSLAQLPQLSSLKYPVTLSLTDAKYQSYTQVLSLLAGAWGERIDQKLARNFAVKQLRESGADAAQTLSEAELDAVQEYNGGVALFRHGDADPVLSARVAAAAQEDISAPAMVQYLYGVTGDVSATPAAVAAAYMGLGALKAPVLQELRALATDEGFTFEERMHLIAGLGFAGDEDTALSAYQEQIAPLLTRENEVAYLRSPADDRMDTFDLTQQALLAAVAVRSPDAAALAAYLCANPSGAALANLELMAYAKAFAPKADSTAKFSYTDSAGARQTVELAKTPVVSLVLGKAAFENANFKQERGQVGAAVLYTASPTQVETEKLDGVTVTKQFIALDGGYAVGGRAQVFIKVTFDSHAPHGYYTVSDYIPSGMRYAGLAENRYNVNPTWQLQSQERQSLTFGLYHGMHDQLYFYEQEYLDGMVGVVLPNPGTDPGRSITESGSTQGEVSYQLSYYVRCVLPGQYTVDSAYLMDSRTGRMTQSIQGALSIQEE